MKKRQKMTVIGGELWHDIPIGSTVQVVRSDGRLVLVAFDDRIYYLKPQHLKPLPHRKD